MGIFPNGLNTMRAWHIGTISFLILVMELALIRFVPSEIKAISYFTNIILFAAFFGLGLGAILQDIKLPGWIFPSAVFALCSFIYVSRGLVVYENAETVHFWLQSFGDKFRPIANVPLAASAMTIFSLVAAVFFPLGHSLASAMSQHVRLYAYGWDLAGSLLGTLVFATTSYLGLAPTFWLVTGPVIFAWLLPFGRDMRLASTIAGLTFAFFGLTNYETKWSPYYLLNYFESPQKLMVFVNSSFHQLAVNFTSKDPNYESFAKEMLEKFSIPYEIYKMHHGGSSPQKVLILGAGTGNDVYVARANQAREITAVEIDPVILQLGKTKNAATPYAHDDVKVVVDDARHYFRRTQEKFDLIVFGTLDSQTLLSGQTNLRLDNYVYTEESFRDARDRLQDGGMVATYYSVFKPWFFGRIYATVEKAFPRSLQIFSLNDNNLFNTIIMTGHNLPGFTSNESLDQKFSQVEPSRDDWPFIYMEKPVLSPVYQQILLFMGGLVLLTFALLRIRTKDHRASPALFLMGVGFTLLESAAIVRLSLLFGATWIVSTVVFSSALLMMFLGNAWVHKRNPNLAWAWGGLLLAILANFLISPASLLPFSDGVKLLIVSATIGVPVLCASLCFSSMFRWEKETGYALGINLIGAMCGGGLEYFSMVIGMNKIWLVVLGIYAAAGVFWALNQTKQKSRGGQPLTSKRQTVRDASSVTEQVAS